MVVKCDYYTFVSFSSQIGSSQPPELPVEPLRPASKQLFLNPSKESVENLRLEMESLLDEIMELIESFLDEDKESLRKEPTDNEIESFLRLEDGVKPGVFLGVLFSCLNVEGKADGWLISRTGQPNTIESLRRRLATGGLINDGIESLLGVIDDLRNEVEEFNAGRDSLLGPTEFRDARPVEPTEPLREEPPCIPHRLSTVRVTTDTLRSGSTLISRNSASRRFTSAALIATKDKTQLNTPASLAPYTNCHIWH